MFYEQYLKISQAMNSSGKEAIAHFNLALIWPKLGEVSKAQLHVKAAFSGFTQAGYTTHAQQAKQFLEQLQQLANQADE